MGTTTNCAKVFTRHGIAVRLVVTHKQSAGRRSEAAQRAHQAFVEVWTPMTKGYEGEWKMTESGGCGGGVDRRGREATYFAEWKRVFAPGEVAVTLGGRAIEAHAKREIQSGDLCTVRSADDADQVVPGLRRAVRRILRTIPGAEVVISAGLDCDVYAEPKVRDTVREILASL